jgi:hypothetical protein
VKKRHWIQNNKVPYRIAAEMCDLPGQGDGKSGFHHPMTYGEAADMNILRSGASGLVKRGFSKPRNQAVATTITMCLVQTALSRTRIFEPKPD